MFCSFLAWRTHWGSRTVCEHSRTDPSLPLFCSMFFRESVAAVFSLALVSPFVNVSSSWEGMYKMQSCEKTMSWGNAMTWSSRIMDYLHLLISNFWDSVLTCKCSADPHYSGLHVSGSSKLRMQNYFKAVVVFDVSEPFLLSHEAVTLKAN